MRLISQTGCLGEAGFDELRQFTKTSSEFFKELIGVLEERSSAEEQYAKSLHKLSARLNKCCKNVIGTMDSCWRVAADEMEYLSGIHRNLSCTIEDEVVKPLRTVHEAHVKSRKTVDSSVDKIAKRFNETKVDQLKAKKKAHTVAKDCEKLAKQSLSSRAEDTPNTPRRSLRFNFEPKKEKVQQKRVKLDDQAHAADKSYHDACILTERQRQDLESVLVKASYRLEALEEQRLANLHTAFGRYKRSVSQIGVQLTQGYRERFDFEQYESFDPKSDLQVILTKCKPTKTSTRLLQLCDFYAEDFDNSMNQERRFDSLHRYILFFDRDIQKEEKQKKGLNHLQDVYSTSAPTQSNENGKSSVRDKLNHTHEMLHFLDFHIYKLRLCMCAMDSTAPRPTHPLARYMEKYKDKLGSRQTILKIPQAICDELNVSPGISITALDLVKDAVDDQNKITSDHSHDFDDFDDDQVYEQLDDIDTQSSAASYTSSHPGGAGPSEPLEDPLGLLCRVLYKYEAERKDELSLNDGDIVRLIQKSSNDWWLGQLNGESGYFPSKFVELVTE